MFDIGWTEMALVAVVALFVVGPKDLPHVLYKMAHYWKKVRGMAREFQGGIDSLIREAELDELRKQASSVNTSATEFLEKQIGGADSKSASSAEKKADTPSVPADAKIPAKSDSDKTATPEKPSSDAAAQPATEAGDGAQDKPKDQPEPATVRTQPEK
ncbi:Sec-independent protein translocase protein TatB [Thalassospira sp. TSL5-1]|uniref:Sec-independent protein translocase protein TatB n=1 Tax=Thalassospira sp. TSL5-1 TaxID=1544451 RepID=UPI00093EE521|nr:Sec-independent protein translocase protein TatB [Thalassospira sp. TSL5-1]OKH89869.1 hypothetical protein LF95_08215 [Thalassospira sp. TSL5-1]